MDICEGYIANAVTFCLATSRDLSSFQDVVEHLKTHDSIIHSKFRYSIARDIAVYLFDTFGDMIRDLRLYGSTMEYTAGIYSDIDMIVCVQKLSDTLRDTLKQLDNRLSAMYYRLIGKDEGEWSYLLDMHILSENPGERSDPSRAYLEHIASCESVAVV